MRSTCCLQIEQQELQAEAERLEREMELEKTREAERQKKLDDAAAKQRAREREIEEREVAALYALHSFFTCLSVQPFICPSWRAVGVAIFFIILHSGNPSCSCYALTTLF